MCIGFIKLVANGQFKISDILSEFKIQELFPEKNFISDNFFSKVESKEDLEHWKKFCKLCGNQVSFDDKYHKTMITFHFWFCQNFPFKWNKYRYLK